MIVIKRGRHRSTGYTISAASVDPTTPGLLRSIHRMWIARHHARSKFGEYFPSILLTHGNVHRLPSKWETGVVVPAFV